MAVHPVLIDGAWRAAQATGAFQADQPATGDKLPDQYPISTWADVDAALSAASRAAAALRLDSATPAKIAKALERYADLIEANAEKLVQAAHQETGLPVEPRLAKAELPRTTGQLRQAAAAARDGSWQQVVIDTKLDIRSHLAPCGPVAVFGPNNFPFAFNSVAGGDFAAAFAAGCPVIAKAHSCHPTTTRIFAELAHQACQEAGLPPAMVQVVYRIEHSDGERLAGDPRLGALAYTGSRSAGLKLKRAADAVGKPIYLELSSVNPVVILPGALRERGAKLVDEFVGSSLMGTGQFCTNPGVVFLPAGPEAEAFVSGVVEKFAKAPCGVLLSAAVQKSLHQAVETLEDSGAELLAGGDPVSGEGYRYANTALRVTGEQFLEKPEQLQTEAFGNACLFVVAKDLDQWEAALDHLEGNLTATIYSHTAGEDDAAYARLAPKLRAKAGRLLNDKMPTGVAVSPAMNHGGPFPATGHPRFTAVGIPAAIERFAHLECYDGVREERLPLPLRKENPTGMWRRIDGEYTKDGWGAGRG